MEQLLCPLFKPGSNKIALITDEEQLSYDALNTRIEQITFYLRSQQIQSGSRVAFFADNTLSTILLFFALFRLQAIACPLSTRLPQEQLTAVLQRLKADHFVDPSTLSFGPILSLPELTLSCLCTFLFTSGSSGTPKIACHTLSNHYYSALGLLDPLRVTEDALYHLSLPLFHVGGIAILFRTFLANATLLLSSSPYLHPVTHLSFVPTQLYRSRATPPPPSLQVALIGGAPIPSTLNHYPFPIFFSYGLTEMSSTVTLQGQILPHRSYKLEQEEIFVRGKTLFQGYWDTAQEAIIPATIDGWFATKDLGKVDNEGHLIILGRKDRQFISGGENIQPEEIEKALCTLPHIVRAKVAPIEDPEFGHRPIAFIEDLSLQYDLATIREALRPLLPPFKHPIALFPMNETLSPHQK